MKEILNELNLENGSKYKLKVLEKYKDNELLKRVLKMTYDKVQYTYGITSKNVKIEPQVGRPISLENALNILEDGFCTRLYTGNKAIEEIEKIINNLSVSDAEVFIKVLDRDLRININSTSINKVWKNLITSVPYMRCGVYSEKTAKKIQWPACIQLKSDGTFRNVIVDNGEVTFVTRSAESNTYPGFKENFEKLPDGVYIGELLVKGISNRSLANGQINSDNPPVDKMYMQLWDYLTLDEFKGGLSNKTYLTRFKNLATILENNNNQRIELIPTTNVNTIQEALQITSKYMTDGYEGAILKDWNTPFKDGTSPTQLKLKLCIDCEVRITGFTEGTKGTKREQYFGAITFENDEETIKGQTSGFSDAQLKDFNSRRDELIGKIITVQFNDLSKAEGNDYYALSHPRFIEIRDDKTITDTLEKVKQLREMAMQLGDN